MLDNYYHILNVDPLCTKKEIIMAYRRLALKWHPDKNKDPTAHDKFVKIAEAYEVLSDTNKRNKYNKYFKKEYTSNETTSDEIKFSFSNPFDIFNSFFPELDKKILSLFSKVMTRMKTVTNYEFLFKLMNEYKYFIKDKNYNINMDVDMNMDMNSDYKSTYTSTHNSLNPPKQVYELEVSLSSYLIYDKVIKIELSMLAKCFTCSIESNDKCHVCKGNLYYESCKIYPVPIYYKEYTFQAGGNFLPNYDRPCNLTFQCKDKHDKYYKRIGNNNLYTYIYWDGHDMIFKYIDNQFYKLNVSANKNKNEPCDFANNIFRVDNMGLLGLNTNSSKWYRGDLFIQLTQDTEYEFGDKLMKDALTFLEYHPENIIEPSEILQIDVILAHFT